MRAWLLSWLKQGDWLVLGAALLLLAGLFHAYWGNHDRSPEARIWVEGKPWARLNLFHDQTLEVPGALGISRIQVADGQVRFVDSPCTTHQCVHTGWLSRGGEVAACLPNRVSVQVIGDDPRFDSMNF